MKYQSNPTEASACQTVSGRLHRLVRLLSFWRWRRWLLDSEQAVNQLRDMLTAERETSDFYRRRVILMEREKHRMRHPEMLLVCDILANAAISPDDSKYRPNVKLKRQL